MDRSDRKRTLDCWIYSAAKHFPCSSLCHRWSLPRAFRYPKPSYTTTTPAASDLPVAMHDHIALGDGRIIWRAWQHKGLPLLVQSDGVPQAPPAGQRESRRRRHANSGGSRGHGHLMRVGCVLGTCQVQNLSHRLYQLIGHSGREDSSPINPHSPHSYG